MTMRQDNNVVNSEIWEYFDVSVVDVTHVNCRVCNDSLSCGGSGKKTSFNTSNLRKHLQSKHDEKWRELHSKEEKVASTKKAALPPSPAAPSSPTMAKQSMLAATLDRKHPWDFLY